MPASTRALALLVGASLMVVLVWALWHPYPRTPLSPRPSARPVGFLVDLNTADAATLQLLPGVGPGIAQNIVNARREGAVFHRPGDLQAVRFIGPSVTHRVGPWVVYSESQPTPSRGPVSGREKNLPG